LYRRDAHDQYHICIVRNMPSIYIILEMGIRGPTLPSMGYRLVSLIN
jgi:hypothetical protein